MNFLRLCHDAYQTLYVGDFICSFPEGCPPGVGPVALKEAIFDADDCVALNGRWVELEVASDTLYHTENGSGDAWIIIMLLSQLAAAAAAGVAARSALNLEATHLQLVFRTLIAVIALSCTDMILDAVHDWAMCSDVEVQDELRCEDAELQGPGTLKSVFNGRILISYSRILISY